MEKNAGSMDVEAFAAAAPLVKTAVFWGNASPRAVSRIVQARNAETTAAEPIVEPARRGSPARTAFA